MDVSRMLIRLGNAGFSDVDSTTLVETLNDVYHDLCALEPWPFLEKELELTFDGTTGIPTNAPTDLRALISLNDYATGLKLDPIRVEEHLMRHGANLTLQGNPIYYFWYPDRTLNVFPIPSNSQSNNDLHLKYLSLESDLTSTTTSAQIALPARFHRAILDGALAQLYLEEDDEAQSDYFQNRMDRRVERMRRDLWTRNFDRPDTIEATSDDMDFYGGFNGADFGGFGA